MDTRETQFDHLTSPTLGFPAQDYVISTELPDQKFLACIVSTMAETTELIKFLQTRFKSRDSRWNNKQSRWNNKPSIMEQQSLQHRVEMEQQAQQHREERQNLLKILDVPKHGTDKDDSSTHHPQLSIRCI